MSTDKDQRVFVVGNYELSIYLHLLFEHMVEKVLLVIYIPLPKKFYGS